jgi:hypothetical protein
LPVDGVQVQFAIEPCVGLLLESLAGDFTSKGDTMRRRFGFLLLVLATPFLLCGTLLMGCGSPKATTSEQHASPKPTKDNWAKVKDGMSEKEVEAIMGPGEGASVDM